MNVQGEGCSVLVREYLRKGGFTKALQEFDAQLQDKEERKNQLGANEMDIADSSMGEGAVSTSSILPSVLSLATAVPRNLTESYMKTYMAEDLILFGINSGEVSLYSSGYDDLRSWALSSLEMVKGELLAVCYPVFVHCYIGLIRRDQKEDARKFWNLFERNHIDRYGEELKQLSLLTSKEQLVADDFMCSNPFVRQASLAKFVVTMSSFGYSLLTNFLVQNDRRLLIASIVNDKISFNVSSQLQVANPDVILENYIPGPTATDAKLCLGVPGKELDPSVKFPDTRDDPLYCEWLRKLVRPRTILKAAGVMGGMVKDDESKTCGKGNALEPSIIFATLTNASNGMTSLHMNNSITQAVAGFRDSSVRVWRFDDNGDEASPFGQSLAGSTEFSEEQNGDWVMSEVLPRPGVYFSTTGASRVDQYQPHQKSFKSAEKKQSGRIPMLELRGHSKMVCSVSQDDTNRLIISSSVDESIRLWDTSVMQCVGKFHCLSPAWGVSFGPLGYYFAAANQDRTVCIYSTDRSAPVRMMTGHLSDATCCTWHDNASLVLSGSDDKMARLWDIRSGSCAQLLRGNHSSVCSVACSHDGRLAATGTENGSVLVWDLVAGKSLVTLQGHVQGFSVHSLAFSADSTALASGSADCTMRVWDVTSLSSFSSSTAPLGGTKPSTLTTSSHKIFHTKHSPVFYVDFTPNNLLFGGGAYCDKREKFLTEPSEIETLLALGVSHADSLIVK